MCFPVSHKVNWSEGEQGDTDILVCGFQENVLHAEALLNTRVRCKSRRMKGSGITITIRITNMSRNDGVSHRGGTR